MIPSMMGLPPMPEIGIEPDDEFHAGGDGRNSGALARP